SQLLGKIALERFTPDLAAALQQAAQKRDTESGDQFRPGMMRAYHRARSHTRGMAILRLTRVPRGTSGVGVRAAGTVVGEFAGLLEQECARALHEFCAVDLDLAGVACVG